MESKDKFAILSDQESLNIEIPSNCEEFRNILKKEVQKIVESTNLKVKNMNISE